MLYHILPVAACLLVGLCLVATLRNSRSWGAAASILLFSCAVLAVGNYTNFGRWRYNMHLNGWEFFHYYLGSKYALEAGYTGLYEAALAADEETGRKFRHEKGNIRDLSTGRYISVKKALARSDAVKGRFSEARWDEFKQDIRYFKSILTQHRWNGVMRDKGYNGTPAWSLIAGALSNITPTSSAGGMLFLALLDPILMAVAVSAVWWAFGYRVALLMVILVGTHMTMSHSHMKGAFLRTDWAMSLVLAVCALKRGRPALGGAFAAYAALARIFPALFAFGLFAKLAAGWVKSGRPQPEHLRFCISFVVVCVLLWSAAMVVQGPALSAEFADKIGKHNDSFSSWRVGFKHVFLGAYEYREPGTGTFQETFHNRKVAWRLILATVLVLSGWMVQRMPEHEALAFGFVPVFFFVAPTYYYYIMLVVPFLYLASRMEAPLNALGLVWLFLSSNVAYLFHDVLGRHLALFYALSVLCLVLCIIMMLAASVRTLGLELSLVPTEIEDADTSANEFRYTAGERAAG